MNRKLFPGLIILLMLVSSCTSKTADKEDIARNDSIKKYLDLAGDMNLDNKKREKYNDKAYSYLDLNKNDTLTRFYLSLLSVNYIKGSAFKKNENISKLHFEKSIKAKDTLNIMRYYWYKASSFNYRGIYDSAFYYYIKAEKKYINIKNKTALANIKFNKGIIQFNVGDYIGAELSLLQAYYFYKNTNDRYYVYGTLNQLGLVYNELADFNNSLRYHTMALKTVKKSDLPHKGLMEAVCHNNIGYLYLNNKKYLKAIENFELGLKYKNVINEDKELYALLKSNLAYSKFEIKKSNEVLRPLMDALKVKKELAGLPVLTNVYIYLSKYYLAEEDTITAKRYAKEALQIAADSKNKLDYLSALRNITGIDKEYLALYNSEYTTINDNLQVAERKSRNNLARIQLETDEITKEKETAIKQKWIILIICGILILIVVLILIITRQRSKQKELHLLQSQQKANEEIYNLMLSQKNAEDLARQQEKQRIAIELHDGVMNRLASTRLNLHILSYKKDDETIRTCMDSVNELCSIEKEIRHIAHDLNLENFNTDSFTSLLTDLVATQNNTTNTNYKLEIDEYINWIDVHASTKMNVYRIIQEACHNINKSAQADNAVISFILDDGNLCLLVTDDGKGFDVNKHSGGMGLKNMKLRVKNMGGKFVIQSRNKSTSLNISIPISN